MTSAPPAPDGSEPTAPAPTSTNPTPTSTNPAPPPQQRRRRPSVLGVLGLVLLLSGLGCLGWVGYQYFGTNVVAHKAYDQEKDQLRASWDRPAPAAVTPRHGKKPKAAKTTAVPGDAIALLRIPRFGPDYEVPVLEGTGLDVLARGVGHYPATAEPGQVGNFAVAGHRVTHGEPFSRLLDLTVGDEVVVETRTAIFTYTIDTAPSSLTVQDSAGWVVLPDPQHPDDRPTQKRITLTTCQDLFHSPDRSIGFGLLTRVVEKKT